MQITAWNNGAHYSDGNGYGIKIDAIDRDNYFRRDWKTIFLHLEGESYPVDINIDKDSFWNKTCRELISVKIGKWLIKNKYAPWEYTKPPIFILEQLDGKNFRLYKDALDVK